MARLASEHSFSGVDAAAITGRALSWIEDDGGRAAAGFKDKKADDCVCRAIAIATGKPYRAIYEDLAAIGWTDRRGHYQRDADGLIVPRSWEREREYIEGLGWRWTPTMAIGSGCKMHLRTDELPSGRIIARVSKHVVAVIDGVLHDTHDASRGGTRCVYGYFKKAN